MIRRTNRVLLLYPPYGDYTYPYHSLSYVAAPLLGSGFEVDVLDMNAIWLRSVFRGETVRSWRDKYFSEIVRLEQLAELTVSDQERLVRALRRLALCDQLDPESAISVLRSPTAFYDPEAYYEARGQMRAFERLLSQEYAPYDFFSAFAIPPHEANAATLVAKALACERLVEDLRQLLEKRCGGQHYLFCGVSISFSAQLVPGFALLEAVGRQFPGCVRVAGGTAVSDIFKYKANRQTLTVFAPLCDYFYIGEAETGVVELAASLQGEVSQPPAQAILLTDSGQIDPPPARYVALATAGVPQSWISYDWRRNPPYYGWIDWDLYLAPERRVNYSPARGCFWNQCTFCDYGLNDDAPTAPSRTMNVEVVVDHLRQLVEQGIHHVYLAVDAISPRFLGALADRLLGAQLELRWSCQFFLTKSFDRQLVDKLAKTGLRTASFGLESGSSRILEAMGKGPNRVDDVLEPVFRAFRDSPVGLQPLFFFGFPGEDSDDRLRTVELLNRHREIFTTISKGGLFDLLPGSIVARRPADFGIHNIRRGPDDDIAGNLDYDLVSGEQRPSCDSFCEFNDQLPHVDEFERPWAGGIDTLHTQLVVDRCGRDIFRRWQDEGRIPPVSPREVSVTSRFDLDEVLQNVVVQEALRECTTARKLLSEDLLDDVSSILTPLVGNERPEDYRLRLVPYREP